MVIGFDASRAFVENPTGTENYSYQLLKSLAKIDGSTLLTTSTENKYIIYIRSGINPYKDYQWPKNFEFVPINFPKLWTQLGLALQTFKDNLDILFVPSHTLPLIRKPGLKTLITVHDLGVEYLPNLHQLKQILYLKLMTHYQIKNATKVIAVSESTKKDLVKKIGIDSKRIEVVYEGVERDVFKSLKKDIVVNILNKFDLEYKKYFLFVGTIQPRKNIERLIRAYSRVVGSPGRKKPLARPQRSLEVGFAPDKYESPDSSFSKSAPHFLTDSGFAFLKLVIVGGKGWLADEIYELPKKLGIEDKVKFLGRVSNNNLVSLYNGALALTLPSLFEGFGLPILEAFACRCPVLTSNSSSTKEIAKDAAVLVDPYNIDSIANALVEISNVKSQMSNIKKGLKQLGKFTWEKCARETVAVFKKVVYG